MSNKRLSIGEKRAKLLEIFSEKKEFFQLKELEKISKEKGLIQNQVKEILQSLVDDGTVESDKIGSTLFYWSFPAKRIEENRKKGDELKTLNNSLKDKADALREALNEKEEAQVSDDELEYVISLFIYSFILFISCPLLHIVTHI